jgi:hypothetical protein
MPDLISTQVTSQGFDLSAAYQLRFSRTISEWLSSLLGLVWLEQTASLPLVCLHTCQRIMATYKLPIQTSTAYSILTGPSKEQLVQRFRGQLVSSVRTPALFIDRAIFSRNCTKMHDNAKALGARFRAHVKTHKVGTTSARCLYAIDQNRPSYAPIDHGGHVYATQVII